MPKSRSLRPFAITTNSQGKRNASPGPPSPTFSETTNVSAVNLGEHGPAKIITRSDLKASMQSYENVSPPISSPSAPPHPLRSANKQLRNEELIFPFSLSSPSFHDSYTHTTALVALEFMLQLSICNAHHVSSYRRARRRNGILCRVRSSASICTTSSESMGILTKHHPRQSHRMKGPSYEQGTRLQAAAGLHHLMGNHWHVLVRRKPLHSMTSTRKRPLTRRPPVRNTGQAVRETATTAPRRLPRNRTCESLSSTFSHRTHYYRSARAETPRNFTRNARHPMNVPSARRVILSVRQRCGT